MGLVGGLMKGAMAKKVFDEARKPHNQQKAKELYARVRGKSSGAAARPTGVQPRSEADRPGTDQQ